MVRLLLLGVLLVTSSASAEPPTPAEHLGFEPGADYKLADYTEIVTYFQKLDEASDRLRLVEFGRSAHGRPMYVAFISSAENLGNLDRYREISGRLAMGLPDAEEAHRLANEGKAIVWIDSGLHSTEVAPAQHAPVLAYRVVTEESDEIRRIRDNVILMQIPVINPDGLDVVVEWYRKNVGTPYELAPLPQLYQKYAGHDNNRDYFMMNLVETRHVSRLLFEEWFPQIVYNQHQQPAFPARIFVPPYAEPLNPNIPSAVMEGINLIGAAMKERFARENKSGVLSYHGFDAWWNGGLRSAPAFHNMHGILTETAAGVYATPRVDDPKDLPKRFRNGLPTDHPTVFYQQPWEGGRWGVREAMDYMLTADFAILDLAATRSGHFLYKAYELAVEAIREGREGKPFAYILPANQWDRSSAVEMLRRLAWGGIAIHRATGAFEAGGKTYEAGAYVLSASQPFRSYLIDLMEPQRYPEIKDGADGPTKRPYDVAGWTLRMNMGVIVDRVDDPFSAPLERMKEIPAPEPTLDHRENESFATVAGLLRQGHRVRWGHDGQILVKGQSPEEQFDQGRFELRLPRLALYEPWTANIDAGWTQWLLDRFEVPYNVTRDQDVREGRLIDRFDSIMLSSQSVASLLHGFRAGEPNSDRPADLEAKSLQRPEYTGGLGLAGVAALEEFVRRGGILIALDDATDLPIDLFPLAVKNSAVSGSPRFYCPGSLLRITLDTSHPLTYGMPVETISFVRGGHAYDVKLAAAENKGDRAISTVASYAKQNLLASGWVSGESAVMGKPLLLDVRHGRGRVILFGFSPQFRGQSFGTFKLLLNAVYWASAKELNG